jgi:radical SAM superfamily enzyme YgiQ (UPF0313 family)
LDTIVGDYGIRNFYFVDDLFLFNLDRLDKILGMIIERNMQIGWTCLGRVDRVTKEILRRMKKAGCQGIHYGIESGDDQILRRIRKGITTDQVRRAIRWTKEVGIKTKGYFMTGLPGDTLQSVQETIDFAKRIDVDEALFSITTPMPGTGLWQELLRQNPQIGIDDILPRAHYGSEFLEGREREDVMYNMSDVKTAELIKLTNEANKFFVDRARRRKAERLFGKKAGHIAWYLYRCSFLRKTLRKAYFTYRRRLRK